MKRVVLGLAVLALGAAGWWWSHGPHRLPARMALETVVDDLAGRFIASPGGEVRAAAVRPQVDQGALRHALLVPPPAAVTFRTDAPADAVLQFAVMVRREQDPTARAPVRFTIEANGRPVYSRTVDATRKRQRRWFEERVPLGAAGAVELTLRTEALGGTAAGTPAWAGLRIVREREVDRQRARPDAPSLLVLLVDTLRADTLGCYGARPSPSPTLDGLARRGRVFDVAVAQSSWTLPATASILTGLNPRSHGVNSGGRDPDAPVDRLWLADGLTTLAEQAQASGVTTVAVSANPLVGPATNLTQGFETFVELRPTKARDQWPDADAVNQTFLDWVRANRGYRFLAYLHYMDPHEPYVPSARPTPPPGAPPEIVDGDVHALARDVNEGTRAPLPADQVRYLRALYDAEARDWDDALARLLNELATLGLAEHLNVLVVADHGEAFQEHGKLTHGVDLHNETLRIPLVLAGPRVAAARIAAPVQGIDVFPTACALLDLPLPGGLAGASLLEEPPADRAIVSELRQGDPGERIALRAGNWKLIHAPASRRSELYDLAADPGEQANRWDDATEGSALLARLHAWIAAAPSPPARAPEPAAGVGVRDRLRALGYTD